MFQIFFDYSNAENLLYANINISKYMYKKTFLLKNNASFKIKNDKKIIILKS